MASKVAEAFVSVRVLAGTVATSMARVRATIVAQLQALRAAAAGLLSTIFSPIGLALGGSIFFATKAFLSLEGEMNRARSVMTATEAEFKSLEGFAKKLGATTAFSAGQSAEAIANFAQAGLDTKEIFSAMVPALDLAAAGGLTVGKAATIMSQTIKGTGKSFAESTDVANVFARAAANANTDISNLGLAFRQVGSNLATARTGFAEATAAVLKLQDAAFVGAQGGTMLRNIMLKLVGPTGFAKRMMEQFKISLRDNGEFVGLNESIRRITAGMQRMNPEQRDLFKIALVGVRNIGALNKLFAIGADELDNMTNKLKSGRTAAEQAQIRMRGLNGALTLMKSAVEGAAIAFGEAMAPTLHSIAAAISSVASSITGMSPELKRLIGGLFAAMVGALAFAAVIVLAGKVVAVLGGALTVLLSPIGLIIAALALIAIAIKKAFESDEFGPRLRAALESISESLSDIFDGFMQIGSSISGTVAPTVRFLMSTFTAMFEAVAAFIAQNKATFIQWGQLIGEIVGGVVRTVVGFFRGMFALFNRLLNAFGTNWSSVWGGIRDFVTDVLDFLSLVFSNFGLSMEIAWTSIKLAAVAAWDFIVNQFFTIVAAGAGVVSAVVGAFTTMWENLKKIGQTIAAFFRATFSAVGKGLKAIMELENPAEAFKEEFRRHMGRQLAEIKPMRGIGEAAAREFNRGFDRVMNSAPPARSAFQEELSRELADQVGRLKAGREAQRAVRNAGAVGSAAAAAAAEDGGAGGGGAAGTRQGGALTAGGRQIEVKFETTGIVDMWKKMQESLTGGTMEELGKRQLGAAEAQVEQQKTANDRLAKIAANTGKSITEAARAG